jgi:tetratricopeptide (TPR) repeat protein
MYLSLGLHKPAVEALKGMETLGRTNDPRVRLALGQGLAALGRDEEARNQLSLVPRPAMQYPAAQFLLVRLEQKAGAIEQAKRRLEALASDSRTVERAVSELINLTMRSREHQQLLDWSDKVLKLNTLPAPIRLQWLAMRRAIQAAKGDLAGLEVTLAMTGELNPDDVAVKAARTALLLHLNRKDEALKLYQSSPTLMSSDVGALLAVAMGQTPVKDARRAPLTRVLESLAAADVAAAIAAAEGIATANNTLYRSDVRAFLAGSVTKAGDLPPAARQTALAAAAMEAALPVVAELAAEGALARNPQFAPAHALLVSALYQQGKSIDQARGRILREMPDSALNLFLSIRESEDADKTQQAIDGSLKLLEREPGHETVRYRLATYYVHLNKIDEALAIMEAMARQPGPLQTSAINDMAYLLAEHKPQRRDEARQWAGKLAAAAPNVPAFADTLGWIEHLDGRHEAAIEHLARSVLAQPGNTETHYHLALAYEAAGQPRWARYHFEAAAAGPAHKAYVKDAAARLKPAATGG